MFDASLELPYFVPVLGHLEILYNTMISAKSFLSIGREVRGKKGTGWEREGGGGGVNIGHSTNCKGMTDYSLDLALSIKGTNISPKGEA